MSECCGFERFHSKTKSSKFQFAQFRLSFVWSNTAKIMLLVFKLILLICTVRSAWSFGSGAPDGTCDSLTPG